MSHPEEAPRIPKLPFLLGDAALLAAAYFIARYSESPLSTPAAIAIAACVGLGAVLAIIPFVMEYTRAQDLALAERQSQIAALAQTTATSAEQLSIASASLHGLAETAARQLKAAEHLPQNLQEKVNEFREQLNEVAVAENETLQQEVNTLRASEAEKLEAAADKVAAVVRELAKQESALARQLAAVAESLGALPVTLEKSGQAAAGAAEKAMAEAGRKAAASLESGVAAAWADAEKRLARSASEAQARLADALARLPEAPSDREGSAASQSPRRKSAKPAVAEPPAHQADPAPQHPSPPESSPAPVVVQADPAVPPVAQPPEPAAAAAPVDGVSETPAAPAGVSETPAAEAPAEPRKPKIRKPRRDEEHEALPGLDLPSDQEAPSDDPAGSLSSDGATRLVATAYIGIGNRLFIRGDGPGLSWDKGVPLHFVSIGKWRWETAEANGPVRAKLYKNDEVECTRLGEFVLEPAHQREVVAAF